MIRAALLAVSALVLFLPPLAFALDRSACKQYGGTTDCWEPVIGRWKHGVCGEVGSLGAWSAATCQAGGGQWLFGSCQNLPPVELRRPVSEADISPLAQDQYFYFHQPLCEGPSAGSYVWGTPISSSNCYNRPGAGFIPVYE